MLNRNGNGRLASQKRAVKDTPKAPNLFQDFVEQVSVGIFVTNEEGRVSLWNSAMERTTGLLGEITLGSFIWDVYFGLLAPDVKQINTLERLREKFLSLLTPGTSDTRGFK